MTQSNFVGRIEERKILNKAIKSPQGELVAVLGRRRVGKTYLIRETFKEKIFFEITGLHNSSLKDQLQNFTDRINYHLRPIIPFQRPNTWQAAFNMLILHFESLDLKEKVVIFFDEFPWIATRKSGFLKAFGLFWNSWASQNNVVVVICGSAASWMIQKVVRDKGGLHNRITRRIHLAPFNLAETKAYFDSKHFNFNHYQIIQLYMAMGGIPHYLKEVEGGQSAAENIDRIFFSKSGFLKEEFGLLYPALFENADIHIKIIKLLAEKWQGLTRKEIITIGKLPNGGTLSKVIEELVHSGFIMPFYTFGKKRTGIRYRLMDEYSIFYLKFIDNKRLEESGMWNKFSQTQTYKIWTGFAFENTCLRHISQIKKALNLDSIYSETSTYRSRPSQKTKGTQIDIIIDRNDQVINLLELKFYNDEFLLTKNYAEELEHKRSAFQKNTKTKKQLFWVLLTTFGVKENEYSKAVVSRIFGMEDLFRE